MEQFRAQRSPVTAARSRHDHFPRAAAERRRLQVAALQCDAAWKAQDSAADGLVSAIEAWVDRDADATLAALAPWLVDTAWLGARLDQALALVAAEPFALPPLRMFHSDGLGGLVLAERGNISLSLMVRACDAAPRRAATAVFVPGHGLTRVIATGGAEMQHHRVAISPAEAAGQFTAAAASPCVTAPPRALIAGELIPVDQASESFSLVGGTGDVVLLQLVVQSDSRLPIREYDIATGQLVKVAGARRDASFRQMALALLRHMRGHRATPLFVASLADADFATRWQAMREFIALDPGAALPHLSQMAVADPHPEVRQAAAKTLALFPPPPASGRRTKELACPA